MIDLIPSRKYRRAVSPVVTTIFLFGVIIAGISVSLGIIYPAVVELEDQITLETAGSSLQTIDDNLRGLLVNGINSQILTRVDVGLGGTLAYNNEIFSTIRLLDGGVEAKSSTINRSRIQILQEVNSDFIAPGDHYYFNGEGNQSPMYLNDTLRRRLTWSVINQTRPIASDTAISSLSYRNIVSSYFSIIPQQLQYNLTISIQMVNITLSDTSASSESGTEVSFGMRYVESTNRLTDWTRFDNDLTLMVTTEFPDIGSSNYIEVPLTASAPSDPGSVFSVRFEFRYHVIELTI